MSFTPTRAVAGTRFEQTLPRTCSDDTARCHRDRENISESAFSLHGTRFGCYPRSIEESATNEWYAPRVATRVGLRSAATRASARVRGALRLVDAHPRAAVERLVDARRL